MSDTASLNVAVRQSGISETDRALERLTATGRRTEQQVDALEDSMQGLSGASRNVRTASNSTTQSLGNVGRSAGQAGIQVQQFVGQVQGGVSPLIALSQQGADLGIVLGAPLVGVLISLGAALAIVATGGEDTADSISVLEERLESLDRVTQVTGTGVRVLTEELRQLARVDEEAARIQIAAAIVDANVAIRESIDSAEEATEAFNTLFNGFDVVATPETLRALDEQLRLTNQSTTELLESNELYATGLTQLASFSQELNDELGLTTDQSVQLVRAFTDLSQTRTPETLQALSTTLFRLNSENGFQNPALGEYNREISDLARRALESGDALSFLNEALELSSSLFSDIDTTAIEGLITRLEDEAATLGATNTERALYTAALEGATEEQLRHIRNLGLQVQAYEDEQRALQESARAQRTREQELERARRADEAAALARERSAAAEEARIERSAQTILTSLQSRQERELSVTQDQILALGAANDERLITDQQFTEASAALWANYYENLNGNAQESAGIRSQLEQQVLNNNISAVQTSTQALLQFTEEGSALGTAAFIANQALTAALVFNQGQVAAAAALAPPPIGLGPLAGAGLAASIEARTIASIGAITAQTVAGVARAQGGEFSAGDSVLLGERGREVVTFDQPGTVAPTSSLQNGGDSGNVVIQQTITVQGNGDRALAEAMEEAAEVGAARGYQAVYRDFKGNGNLRRLTR